MWARGRGRGSGSRTSTHVGAKGEVSTAAAHASGRPPPVFLASPPSKACAMRSPTSSEHACPTCDERLCSGLLMRTPPCVALVESVLRPGGWENMCRLMCHCVRHIDVDNKHGRCVEVINSFTLRWKACTELCAGTQTEEPCGKKSSMGIENRQRCSPRFRTRCFLLNNKAVNAEVCVLLCEEHSVLVRLGSGVVFLCEEHWRSGPTSLRRCGGRGACTLRASSRGTASDAWCSWGPRGDSRAGLSRRPMATGRRCRRASLRRTRCA